MSWIRIESGAIINLDHIEEIQLSEPIEKLGLSYYRVIFYPTGESDPITACKGSFVKCKHFMRDLESLLQTMVIETMVE